VEPPGRLQGPLAAPRRAAGKKGQLEEACSPGQVGLCPLGPSLLPRPLPSEVLKWGSPADPGLEVTSKSLVEVAVAGLLQMVPSGPPASPSSFRWTWPDELEGAPTLASGLLVAVWDVAAGWDVSLSFECCLPTSARVRPSCVRPELEVGGGRPPLPNVPPAEVLASASARHRPPQSAPGRWKCRHGKF
jgi:hypothetical protein